jgi:hypothetical protein
LKAIPLKTYEEDIRRLDVILRELKIKYDQFFAGALDRQPFELRVQAERIIDRLGKNPPGKFAPRFHFNSLVSRFNSFSELWSKTLRTMEEGDHRSQSVAERFGLKERLITRCLVRDPEHDRADLHRLHSRFVAARERRGKRSVSFEKFVRGIASQTRQLRVKHECSQIEVRVVESGDEVQIRARPGR